MADTTREVGKRYSKYHPSRPCTKCILCGKSSAYSHFEAWSDVEKHFLKKHWNKEVDPSSCICVAHQKEAKRLHHPDYIPKWSNIVVSPTQVDVKVCMYPSCTSTAKLIAPSFAPLCKLKDALQIKCGEDTQILICSRHYHELYSNSAFNPVQVVALNLNLVHLSQDSPNPCIINEVLHGNSVVEEGEMLTLSDYIMFSLLQNPFGDN